MFANSNDTCCFMTIVSSDPGLIPAYTICTPFDDEILGRTQDNTQLEEFVETIKGSYKMHMEPILKKYEEERQKDLRLCGGKKGQSGFPKFVLKNKDDDLQKQDGKSYPRLKKTDTRSPLCTKQRRRTSVIRKAVAENNRAKALKAKEEREKRQHAALNRRQGLVAQGDKCSGRSEIPSNSVAKNVVPSTFPKKQLTKTPANNEEINNINDKIPRKRSARKRASRKKLVCKALNGLPSSISSSETNSENNRDRVPGQIDDKPIKGVLKKKVLGKSDHNKSVRFNETTTTFDIEKVSVLDATNIIYNFDAKDIPSWAKDDNLDQFLAEVVNMNVDNKFPFYSSELIEY